MNLYLPRHLLRAYLSRPRHMARQPHPRIPWLRVPGLRRHPVQSRDNHRHSKCHLLPDQG